MPEIHNDLLYKIALTKIPKIGAIKGKLLLSYCGSLEEVFKSKRQALLKIPNIGPILAEAICDKKALERAKKELDQILKYDIKVSFFLDPDYPYRLKQYPDCPVVLYSKGDFNWNKDRMVAIVGTRVPSSYGKMFCESLISDLSKYKVTIVSGMAHGIDSIAHRAAVNHQIETIGVLGSGIGRIYPSSNLSLSQRMILNGGLISEFSFYQKPDRENFPKRNRIVAGMCDAVIVIESKEKGGSLITANYANEYNKDVFALPGNVGRDLSLGCNKLIKEHKASLMESAKDISYIMGWEEESNSKKQGELFVQLNEEELIIKNIIDQQPNISIDQLSQQLNWNLSKISKTLLELEFKGDIIKLPGKKFVCRLN